MTFLRTKTINRSSSFDVENLDKEFKFNKILFFLTKFPHGHYLVWWVRVSFGVRVELQPPTLTLLFQQCLYLSR